MQSENEAGTWQPSLAQMPSFGLENQYHTEWPSMSQLKRLNLSKELKLASLELSYSTSLYQLKLHFTGGVASEVIGVKTPKS